MSMHNPDGSRASRGVTDNAQIELHAEPAAQLYDGRSMLLNPGTDSDDDRSPAGVPMYPYGHEGQGDALFSLEPEQKG